MITSPLRRATVALLVVAACGPSQPGPATVVVPVPVPQPAGPPPVPEPRASPASACPPGMVAIAGGTFSMGTTEGYDEEKPVHSVTLSPYCLDETEVTVRAYAQCASCRRPDTGGLCNAAGAERDDHPQNCVSWDDAARYCAQAGKRLPTEAEWEYVARGGAEGRTWPWGSSAPTSMSACWGRKDGTCRVKSFPAGAFGVYDMAGNVEEWVSDRAGPYPSSAMTDPTGPSNGTDRMLRGGAWSRGDTSLRGTDRHPVPPAARGSEIGFRCAMMR